MSRLGRNYIEVGRLTEDFFPESNIRLVAVSNGIDTDEGENELTPINYWRSKGIKKPGNGLYSVTVFKYNSES